MTRTPPTVTRRTFLQATAGAAVPLLLPGCSATPRPKQGLLRLGCIGVGRQGSGDMQALLAAGLDAQLHARIVAVCDVDRTRVLAAKKTAEAAYAKKLPGGAPTVATYGDFRELLARDDLDGVLVATPDHWHAGIAIAAAKAGKGIYLEKPLTYTIREGQQLVAAVRQHRVVLQVGSQQRSDARFRQACELVRNGRLGKLQRIEVTLPPDSGTGDPKTSPIPEGFDYDTWLGPRGVVPYAEQGVHPQKGYGRPGWLQIQRYCLGMITGWGSHMNDIAQWGHGGDTSSGPVEFEAKAEFPQRGLFDVHTKFSARCVYADGVELLQATGDPAGVKFTGERGWIFVRRGAIAAEPAALLQDPVGAGDLHLPVSTDHFRNFLQCLRSGEDPICPVEVGHRSNTVCVVTHIAMKLGRKLQWDPIGECFVRDDEANAMLDYPHRAPWKP